MKTRRASFVAMLLLTLLCATFVVIAALYASDHGAFRYNLRAPLDWKKVEIHFAIGWALLCALLFARLAWQERPKFPLLSHVRGPF